MLPIGTAAPDFALRDQHGQEQTLASRRGSRNVLLVFYPFAFTGVCTGELRSLNVNASTWASLDVDVIAMSCDPIPSLRAFADQEKLEIPLVSDFWPHGAVATAYDAFESSLGAAGRATYVIDRHGVIRWSVRSAIPDARDITDYVTALAELGATAP
jgi:peroxiredoxin